jgi:hypothetical protein
MTMMMMMMIIIGWRGLVIWFRMGNEKRVYELRKLKSLKKKTD